MSREIQATVPSAALIALDFSVLVLGFFVLLLGFFVLVLSAAVLVLILDRPTSQERKRIGDMQRHAPENGIRMLTEE